MKYIVYLTTNKVNGHIYIGVHKTENPDVFDGYIGDGAYINKPSSYNKAKYHLHQAICKYGTSAFYRETLKVFDNLDDALDLEAFLVTEEFVKRTDTYNMTVGGNLPPICTKTIYEFDLNGNYIKTWKSIKSIIDTYKVNHDRIWMAIKDKRSFNNSYWSTEQSIDVSEFRVSHRGYVYQYNKDGVLLNMFESASIAALKLDINRDAIISAVHDRTTCHGYYFLNATEDINQLLFEKRTKINAKLTPVYRYLLDGTFDKEYNSIKDACLDVDAKHSNIIRAIKNNKTSKGYRWSYIKSDKIEDFNETHKKAVKIAQYDLDHNLVKIWDSISDCKKEFPSCLKVCKKQRKTSKGFIFEYVKDIV